MKLKALFEEVVTRQRHVYASISPLPDDKADKLVVQRLKPFGKVIKKLDKKDTRYYFIALDPKQASPRDLVDHDDITVHVGDYLPDGYDFYAQTQRPK